MDTQIDVTFDFTSDTPNYWECFYAGIDRPDPDSSSPTMKKYQQLLYRKVLPNGEFFDLHQGNSSENYLYWKDFRFGSDSIINMYIHHKTLNWLIDDIKKQINNFNKFYEEYLRKSYTIGGEIIFPKYPIAVNGIVNYVDDSDGLQKESCILSILTKEQDFARIDLNNVDYIKCFRRLKGISSANLSEYVAITPIIHFNKDDKRFIEGKDVISTIDNSVNLAAMDWKDFENLVRDLFEKEFCTEGAEVKITQSSHDGGVDAVIFDPDPIRGGKFVIQAKRYTNVVNVSAVRDLFGTIHNEGAVKGILVTTSNFGIESYDFAKDKPITLISGNELLHLLAKHNVNAKIDIKEAKKILGLEKPIL